MLKVSRQPSGEPEIFESIQGEGFSAGSPTVFLRLATCNLACTWCDTRYTWDWKTFRYGREVVSLSREDVEKRVLSFDQPHLVVTGGEPLLQQEELAPLVARLNQRGLYCEVETNGTIAPEPEMIEAISQWNVSPKTAGSGNRREVREKPAAIHAFRELENASFKFVIGKRADLDDVSALVAQFEIAPDRVLLMPEGVAADTLRDRGRWVAEACVERGYRFTTRLHILLWGDERGK